MSDGFRQNYPTVLDALVGGEAAAFASVLIDGISAKMYALSGIISLEAVAALAWGGTWPTKPGYIYVPDAQGRFVFSDLTGAAVATPAFSVGTNAAAYDNIIAAATISAATLNGVLAAGGGKNSDAAMGATTQKAHPELTGTAPHVNVTTAVTGGTTCKGRIVLSGSFVPLTP